MKKIALVEDNPDNALLIKVLLGDTYEVELYCDGFSALEGLQKSVPDLILLDISLPRMDGIQVLQHLRQIPVYQTVPVIAVTAHSMKGDRQKFLDLGFNDYIPKPITDEKLFHATIKRLIR